jgi:hypothetical protein
MVRKAIEVSKRRSSRETVTHVQPAYQVVHVFRFYADGKTTVNFVPILTSLSTAIFPE